MLSGKVFASLFTVLALAGAGVTYALTGGNPAANAAACRCCVAAGCTGEGCACDCTSCDEGCTSCADCCGAGCPGCAAVTSTAAAGSCGNGASSCCAH